MAAAGERPPRGWFQNRPSRAEWTSVPFTVQTVAGSGRRSMAVKRKARAQSRNAVTLDGDSERGGSNGTGRDYDGGVPSWAPRAAATAPATTAGRSSGPKWPIPGKASTAACVTRAASAPMAPAPNESVPSP